jgi:hypothetical protein
MAIRELERGDERREEAEEISESERFLLTTIVAIEQELIEDGLR